MLKSILQRDQLQHIASAGPSPLKLLLNLVSLFFNKVSALQEIVPTSALLTATPFNAQIRHYNNMNLSIKVVHRTMS